MFFSDIQFIQNYAEVRHRNFVHMKNRKKSINQMYSVQLFVLLIVKVEGEAVEKAVKHDFLFKH